ncbi:MAG: hypothetical protein QF473_23120 [Planctomycetota bacterium]|jgi:hypothetical protein|nr:hypothetical protein [Planctomycetota bacterium]MDP6506016.1 hypothetical protein [Planctomycetota bacterium]
MKPNKRSIVSLLTALSFGVLSVSGVLAFARPFSIQVVGLHALMGFVFIVVIAFHVANNFDHLSRYVRSKGLWTTLIVTVGLTGLFLWQPKPIRSILGLSKNLGPALDRFEMKRDGLVYRYSPAPHYKMALTIRAGNAFDRKAPPHVAIWLENASYYHIKTLREPEDKAAGRAALPYWDFKVRGWEEAKRKAEKSGKDLADLKVDAVSGATQNSSFDPADYILPSDPENRMPYRLLIEIDQPEDEQPSLVYAVEIENADPRVFQLLELVGYPKREEDDKDGKEVWSLYYVDETFSSALDLIDSALLTIEREQAQ